jgi:hypothetical protein
MKGGILITVILLVLLSLIGCQTVPRHLVREEVVIIYYEPIYVDPPYYVSDPPALGPPTQPITNPKFDNPPPRDLQSDNQNNGGSYGKRDQSHGLDDRQPVNTKTLPPVKKPERNDRVQ